MTVTQTVIKIFVWGKKRGSKKVKSFLDKNISLVPLLPVGQHVLEVKYDEFLPEYIGEVLELGSLQRTSFSKYYYARSNEINIR